ncbi:hypothetical protein A2Z33_02935 [Candidatus Gottesmanbacteria bacterium RBG_16_52_11]|uniref:Uncharacterized protein n=1 Tax=Candidatus Gottesmanbacteria bacterium RBG_16_52_11 TaxID=1798374 RepID=A0A1F5YMS6_9BACT|nr:MAG: hypothetical protein A2Z33_02935 [Candidatus Gottesmanbacteria bacterium RBG_16_52_11]
MTGKDNPSGAASGELMQGINQGIIRQGITDLPEFWGLAPRHLVMELPADLRVAYLETLALPTRFWDKGKYHATGPDGRKITYHIWSGFHPKIEVWLPDGRPAMNVDLSQNQEIMGAERLDYDTDAEYPRLVTTINFQIGAMHTQRQPRPPQMDAIDLAEIIQQGVSITEISEAEAAQYNGRFLDITLPELADQLRQVKVVIEPVVTAMLSARSDH